MKMKKRLRKKYQVLIAFAPFLAEVEMTYGGHIRDICCRKLSRIRAVEEVDELAILAEAKQEAGFKQEFSSLAFMGQRFTS